MSFNDEIEALTSLTADAGESTIFLTAGAKDVTNRIVQIRPDMAALFAATVFLKDGNGVDVNGGILNVARENGTAGTDYVEYEGVTVTKANPAVFTVGLGVLDHDLNEGDTVELSGFTEMTELNGMTTQVLAIDIGSVLTTFTLEGIDSTNYGSAETATHGTVKRLSVDNWVAAKRISPDERYLVNDSSSLAYRTKHHPAFWEIDGKVYVHPTPSTAGDRADIHYITYVIVSSGATSILDFPDQYEHLVIIYAAGKTLLAYMGTIDGELPSDVALPVAPTPPSLIASSISLSASMTYTAPVLSVPLFPSLSWTMPSVPIAPAISSGSVTITGTAPTYTSPVLSISGFPSLSWVMPSAPVTPVLTGATLGELGDIPTYTQPVSSPDFAAINTQILADEEELATLETQKVGVELTKYQSDIQNALNVFQKENSIYQANLQKDTQAVQVQTGNDGNLIQKYSADITEYSAAVGEIVQANQGQIAQWQQENTVNIQKYTAEIQNALNKFNEENVEYQSLLQKDIQDTTLVDGELAKQLQKYSAEIQAYGGEVGAISTTNQGQVTEWQAEAGLLLQKYTAELTNSTAEFNKTQVEYQAALQIALQEAQLIAGDDNQKIQQYTAEVQSYSSNSQSILADYGAKVQKLGAKYQWAHGRYGALRQEYNDAFGLLAPPKQQGGKR